MLLSRVLIIAIPLLVFILILVACASRPIVPTPRPTPQPTVPGTASPAPSPATKSYTDPTQPIEIRAGESFAITLKSNPTTGYAWQETHDEGMVQLMERKFVPDAPPSGQPLVGAGGTDTFLFKAVKAGETTITVVYQRPWEKDIPVPPGNRNIFTVKIK